MISMKESFSKGCEFVLATKKRTQKQKNFDLSIKYGDSPRNFTRRVKLDDYDIIEDNKDKIVWSTIIRRDTVTNEFIERYKDKVYEHCRRIVIDPAMPIEFIRNNKEYIDWRSFCGDAAGGRFDRDFVKEFWKYIKPYAEIIIRKPHVDTNVMLGICKKINNYYELNFNTALPKNKIDILSDYLDWGSFPKYSIFILKSLNNIKAYQDKIDFYKFTTVDTVHFASRVYNGKKRYDAMIFSNDFLNYGIKNDLPFNWESIIKNKDNVDRTIANKLRKEFINGMPGALNYNFFRDHKDYFNRKNIPVNKWLNENKTNAENVYTGIYRIYFQPGNISYFIESLIPFLPY